MPTYQEIKTTADERWQRLTAGERPWIRVGTAMCGHAAGAYEVIDALKAEVEKRDINAVIDEVGCLGICYAEPLVDILKPSGSRLFFHNLTPEDVPEIIESYLVEDTVPETKVLGYMGDDPIDGVGDMNDIAGINRQLRIALRTRATLPPTTSTSTFLKADTPESTRR